MKTLHDHALFDTRELVDLIETFDKSEQQVKQALAATLNDEGKNIEIEARAIVERETQLTAEYIRNKLFVRTRAKANRLVMVLGAEMRPVLLSHFNAQQVYKGGSNGRVKAGVSVQVKRIGGRKTLKSGFFIPLKRGKEKGMGSMGLAVRPGKNGMKLSPSSQRAVNKRGYTVLHGPSVDQVFSSHIERLTPSVDDMFATFLDKIN